MNKQKHRATLLEIYKTYEGNLTYKEYRSLLEDFFTLISIYLIKTGKSYKMPHGLGTLIIRKRKGSYANRAYINYQASRKYNKPIIFNNAHSAGYFATFKWEKKSCYLKNKTMFSFVPTRWAKRFLAKQIIENNTITKYL